MSSKKSSSFIESHYESCLELYWNGQYGELQDRIPEAIHLSQEPQTEFFLYRLWIQVLVLENDLQRLQEVKDHLNTLAFQNVENRDLYFSLIALSHFELGEVEAAHLMVEGSGSRPKNLYQKELIYYLGQNDGTKSNGTKWLLNYKFQDYIVFENLVLSLASADRFDASLALCDNLIPSYKAGMLKEKVQLELIKKLGHSRDLLEISSQLLKRFQGNYYYRFVNGVAFLKCEDFASAIQVLVQDLYQNYQSDCLSLTLIGQCYLEQYKIDQDEEWYQLAHEFLDKAITVGREIGQSIDTASNLKARLRDMKGLDVELTGKFWLTKLNANHFANLRTKEEKEIQYIRRPLGAQAKPGDLCFLVYEEKKGAEVGDVWRLGALYKVMEEPEWDPIHRYQNLLELQFRHEIAVPINIKVEGAHSQNGVRYQAEDPRRYDVYEMDQSAFDTIIENVCDTLGQEDQLFIALNALKTA